MVLLEVQNGTLETWCNFNFECEVLSWSVVNGGYDGVDGFDGCCGCDGFEGCGGIIESMEPFGACRDG